MDRNILIIDVNDNNKMKMDFMNSQAKQFFYHSEDHKKDSFLNGKIFKPMDTGPILSLKDLVVNALIY